MSTSLQEQLRKLAVPQSSAVERGKKRPSIFFAPEDAAEKSNETIYQIGIRGLEELIKKNRKFEEYRNSLFHETYKNFERSVHDATANAKLDKMIKKFFLYLSPYFALRHACMALEWLIYRFKVHEYNREDFIMMILPYHETNMFVRALQVVNIKGHNDEFYWLKKLQRNGVHLSKNVLYNHAASNPKFLKDISTYIISAVKLHDEPGHLDILFNFYCLTLCGGIHHCENIDDRYITAIIPVLLKGLKSNFDNYLSASLLVLVNITKKTNLSEKILNKFVENICSNCDSTERRECCLKAVMFIYQMQKDFNEFSIGAIRDLSRSKWIPKVFEKLNEKYDTHKFFEALFKGIFKTVRGGEDDQEVVDFFISILNVVTLGDDLVVFIIRLIYEQDAIHPETISFLKNAIASLEVKYPMIFDKEINNLLKLIPGETPSIAQKRFQELLSSTSNLSTGEILQKLYHPIAKIRKEAIKQLVPKLRKLKNREQMFLQIALLDRINDDNPEVVFEVLKSSRKFILNVIEDQVLVKDLVKVLAKCQKNDEEWNKVAKLALNMICENYRNDDLTVFISIFSYMLPSNEQEFDIAQSLLDTEYLKKSVFSDVRNLLIETETAEEFTCVMLNTLRESKIDFGKLMKSLNHIHDENFNVLHKYLTSFILCSILPKDSPLSMTCNVYEVILTYLETSKLKYASKYRSLATGIGFARKNKFPLQAFLNFIEILIEKSPIIDLSKHDFSTKSPASKFYISVFSFLLKGCCTVSKPKISFLYANTLKTILTRTSSEFNMKILTLLNVSIANNDEIVNVLKLRCLRTINSLLELYNDGSANDDFVLKILICFENEEKEIRLTGLRTVEILLTKRMTSNVYLGLMKNIIQYKEEILLDRNQISIAISNILDGGKEFKEALKSLIKAMEDSGNPSYITIGIGNLLVDYNNLEIYNKLSEICLQILNSRNKVSQFESEFINKVINKLDVNLAQKLTTKMKYVQLIFFAIENPNVMLIMNDGEISISLIGLSKIGREIFEQFPDDLKAEILKRIIKGNAISQNPDIISTANRIFKHIDLDSKLIIDHLIKMRDVQSAKITETKRKRRISIVPTADILDTSEWKEGIVVLEYIHDKKKIRNPSLLLPVFFEVLKKCLDFDEQSNVEYSKQLILSSILNSCKRAEDLENLPENVFNVETIVQCIRASPNPQTHHDALSVLAHTATLMPKQVLHHIMAIFTFMGSSVLRYDDSYSFQIINKIVDTIIPILVENDSTENIINILRVFVDAILDVPEHRRMTVYTNLLEKIGIEKNLYIFLMLMCEAHVTHENSEKVKGQDLITKKEYDSPKRLDIAADIAKAFPTNLIILSCTNLMKHLYILPQEKDNIQTDTLIDMKHYSSKQFRHYKYIIITFISGLLSSKDFVHRIAGLPDETLLSLEPIFKDLIINTLSYIQKVAKTATSYENTPQGKYWKVMLHHAYDTLDSVNALLTPQMFLLVVRGLTTHNLITVRRRALELLNSKLQHDQSFFKSCSEAELHHMTPALINMVRLISNNNTADTDVLIQTALLSLKLFFKLLSPISPDPFLGVLHYFASLISNPHNAKPHVLSSVVLCAAELCSQLKAHAIPSLPAFMPALISLLRLHRSLDLPDLVLLSTVTAVLKVLESLPLFMSPFLEKLLFQLSSISGKWRKSEDPKIQQFLLRVNNIKLKIGSSIPPRVLIPAVAECYEKIIQNCRYQSITHLMEILLAKLKHMDNSDIQSHLNDLTSFFMVMMEFRSKKLTSLEVTNKIEKNIIKTFVVLILKLSESSFRPVYYKIYDWAARSDTKSERIITFYAFSSEIANYLKGLFVLFAGHFLNDSSKILDSCNLLKQTDTYFEDDEKKSLLLLEYVLKTLHAVFLYDSQRFINKERFDVLMQPIVDQLENTLGGDDLFVSRVNDLVVPTIVQLAVATGDDALWKQLNYQVLLKMRHTNSKIRLGALRCILEVSRKLGEEFLPLLPETIPFLAELLEDEEEEVEKTCKKTIQEMEKILGEPLQKYF